jgi:hypothetical protein
MSIIQESGRTGSTRTAYPFRDGRPIPVSKSPDAAPADVLSAFTVDVHRKGRSSRGPGSPGPRPAILVRHNNGETALGGPNGKD